MYKHFTANELRARFGLADDFRVDAVIAYGTRRNIRYLLDSCLTRLPFAVTQTPVRANGFYDNVIELTANGKRVWFEVVYGGAYLSEVLHVAALFGSRKNILLGSCGGLKPTAMTPDIVIPESSFGNESTTRMYMPQVADHLHYADAQLAANLKARCLSLEPTVPIHEGRIITCQAILAETWEDVQAWSAAGYVGVEMESACHFAVSNHFGIPSAALLYVVDNLIAQETMLDLAERDELRAKIGRVAIDNFCAALEEAFAT